MIQHVYQLSIPYVARRVEIESTELWNLYGVVKDRVNDVRPIVSATLKVPTQ
jgi:hypothetical protein